MKHSNFLSGLDISLCRQTEGKIRFFFVIEDETLEGIFVRGSVNKDNKQKGSFIVLLESTMVFVCCIMEIFR